MGHVGHNVILANSGGPNPLGVMMPGSGANSILSRGKNAKPLGASIVVSGPLTSGGVNEHIHHNSSNVLNETGGMTVAMCNPILSGTSLLGLSGNVVAIILIGL